MNRLDRFDVVAMVLFDGVRACWEDNLDTGAGGSVGLDDVAWRKDSLETLARLLREEFGEDALVERITELQQQLMDAQTRLRLAQGERELFPEVAHV